MAADAGAKLQRSAECKLASPVKRWLLEVSMLSAKHTKRLTKEKIQENHNRIIALLTIKKLKLEELLLYLLGKDPQKLYSLLIVAENDEDLQLRKAVESNIGTPVTVPINGSFGTGWVAAPVMRMFAAPTGASAAACRMTQPSGAPARILPAMAVTP